MLEDVLDRHGQHKPSTSHIVPHTLSHVVDGPMPESQDRTLFLRNKKLIGDDAIPRKGFSLSTPKGAG
jgi:hypothetical protein